MIRKACTVAAPPSLGVALMIASTTTMPVVDGIAKHLSATYTVLFISWARCCSGAFWVTPCAIARYKKGLLDRRSLVLLTLRAFLLLAAMMLYYAAIARVPMADALGAYFISPIVVTLLSGLLLKERLSIRRVTAVMLGFAGVVIMIRPGLTTSVGILLAAASGTTFAFYILTTRIMNVSGKVAPTVMLAFQYLFGAILLAPLAWSKLTAGSESLVWLVGLMGALSLLAHGLEIAALRYAQPSMLAPFMYTEMVAATLIGYLFFHDFPDQVTWLGITIVVAAGLITLGKEQGAASHA